MNQLDQNQMLTRIKQIREIVFGIRTALGTAETFLDVLERDISEMNLDSIRDTLDRTLTRVESLKATPEQVQEELNRIRLQFAETFKIPSTHRTEQQQEFLQAAFDVLYKPTEIVDLTQLLNKLQLIRVVNPDPVLVNERDFRDTVTDRSQWIVNEANWALNNFGTHRARNFLPRMQNDGQIPVQVHFLNMAEHPKPSQIADKYFDVDRGITFEDGRGLIRMSHSSDTVPIIKMSRYWYNRVGRPHLWYERNLLTDAELFAYYRNPLVDMYAFTEKDVPVGFAELDWRTPGRVELAYFGIFEEYQGRGLGKWALDTIVDVAWTRSDTLQRMTVSTNSLDGIGALSNYLRAGFVLQTSNLLMFPDPRVIWMDRMTDYTIQSYPWPKTPEYNLIYERIIANRKFKSHVDESGLAGYGSDT